MNDFAALARLIQAIEPWRVHLVIVGGWAHRLYRFHPTANVPTYQPLLTRDTDVAFANQAPLEGDIKSALAHAGFIEEFSGSHQPPVTRYTLGDDDAGFYAEFLTPLHGSEVKRSGAPQPDQLHCAKAADTGIPFPSETRARRAVHSRCGRTIRRGAARHECAVGGCGPTGTCPEDRSPGGATCAGILFIRNRNLA